MCINLLHLWKGESAIGNAAASLETCEDARNMTGNVALNMLLTGEEAEIGNGAGDVNISERRRQFSKRNQKMSVINLI